MNFDSHMRHIAPLNVKDAEIFCTLGVSKLFMTEGHSGYFGVVLMPCVDM